MKPKKYLLYVQGLVMVACHITLLLHIRSTIIVSVILLMAVALLDTPV